MTNVNRLIAYKMSRDAVPSGGGFKDALSFLASPGRLTDGAKAARQWVESAILAVRQAAEPNSWKDATDEDIAGEIVKQIEAKKQK